MVQVDDEPRTAWLHKAAQLLLIGYWITLFVGTHWPRAPELLGIGQSDKLLHLTAYFVLAVLLGANVALRRHFGWWPALLCLAAIVAFGAFDEITQPPFGRDANGYDWLADCVGAAAGLIAVAAVAMFWRRPAA
ncbi:MAG: VanZ family protein [Pirellulales bacterium]